MMDKNFLLVNKPAGWTSFDAVNFLRKKIIAGRPEMKNIKIGHAGTLDPFATGLLVVAVGREATRRIDEFKSLPKTYIAQIHLGALSDTYDKTGVIIDTTPAPTPVDLSVIQKTLAEFIGPQLQAPPMYSAKKVRGKRLYKLAREGKIVNREPAKIEIHNIEIKRYDWPNLTLRIVCSPGTYIRSLAHDLGGKLGVGAFCAELTRTAIGPYELKNAQNLQ